MRVRVQLVILRKSKFRCLPSSSRRRYLTRRIFPEDRWFRRTKTIILILWNFRTFLCYLLILKFYHDFKC